MGYLWALASVLLVSMAQLMMKYAMTMLPPATEVTLFFQGLLHNRTGTLALFIGLCGYAASMMCWYQALHKLALSKAYSLLSISYILVWAAAICLPGLNGVFSWGALAGVSLICAGVVLIFRP